MYDTLAEALLASTPYRDQNVALAFGLVLFTLVVQGLTLRPLIRRLGLGQASSIEPAGAK